MTFSCKVGTAFVGLLAFMAIIQHYSEPSFASPVVHTKAAPARSLNLAQTGQTVAKKGTANATAQANACRCGTCCESDMCLADNGMWDDCMGPLASPEAPPKAQSTGAAAPSMTKKPPS